MTPRAPSRTYRHGKIRPEPAVCWAGTMRPAADVAPPEPSSLKHAMVRKVLEWIAALRKDRSVPEQAGATAQFATVAADDSVCDSLVQAGRCVWVPEEWVRERQADGFVLYCAPDSRRGMVRIVVPGSRGAVEFLMECPPGSSCAATTPEAQFHSLRAQSRPPREGRLS